MRRVLETRQRRRDDGIAREFRHADRSRAPASAARRAGRLLRDHSDVLPRRRVERGILRTEESDHRNVERGGEMQWSAVGGDEQRRATQHLDQASQAGMTALEAHELRARALDRLGEWFLTRPGDHTDVETRTRELPAARDESLDRPAFERSELARSRVQQDERSCVARSEESRDLGLDLRVASERGEEESVER